VIQEAAAERLRLGFLAGRGYAGRRPALFSRMRFERSVCTVEHDRMAVAARPSTN
jgi:hypothetical protein